MAKKTTEKPVKTIEKTKQQYNLDRYVKNIKEGKEVYQERKDFLKNFSLKDSKKKKKDSGGTDGGESTGGSVVLNGDMPTIKQYVGPDTYYDDIIKENYQSGLKAKLEGTDKWNKDIIEQAGKAGVNPLFVKVIMATESGGNHSSTPNAYDCVGLMQVQGATATGLSLDWNKVRNDEVYNIYAGCLVMKSKLEYAKGIINRGKNPYADFKSRGYELKATCHGVAWLYNGFSVPSNGSSKVTSGGYIYANQIAAMYAGFGRDAHKDTPLTTDVLGSGSDKKKEDKKEDKKDDKKKEVVDKKKEDLETASIRSVGPGAKTVEISQREPLSQDETEFLEKAGRSYNVPVGKMKGNYFSTPKYTRDKYIEDRKTSKLFVSKQGYAPLPAHEFIHLAGPQENYYPKEARDVFLLLKQRIGLRQVIVVRGYEPMSSNNESSHTVGIAMDIQAKTPEEAIRIADTAWLLGIRSIAIGPRFVHLDVGPESVWGYDSMPVYRGPGTIKAGGIKRAYK